MTLIRAHPRSRGGLVILLFSVLRLVASVPTRVHFQIDQCRDSHHDDNKRNNKSGIHSSPPRLARSLDGTAT
jgi:hypothetical protein